jgi:dienelactone hydrolase
MRAWCLLIALAAAGCGTAHRQVTLAVHARSALVDSPPRLDVSGLTGTATLRASWRASDGTEWVSSTPISAGRLRGTRFLWGMRPAGPHPPDSFRPPPRGRDDVALSVVRGGRTLARARLPREITPPAVGVRQERVARDGIDGTLFTPPGHGPHPGVLVFGGSEGGDSMVDVAGLLAAHGYTTLSLAYFAEPGLPRHLLNVPLEYFARALRVLRRQPGVDRVATLGASRGGEASLLVAATFPRLVGGAIALAPSDRVQASPVDFRSPAWTYRGRPVPRRPIALRRIAGPVLAASAGDDRVWPSWLFVEHIHERLASAQSVNYLNAGHDFCSAVPYIAGPTDQDTFGGTAAASAAARADIWRRILRFLANLQP